jgi:hypothetical protein
MDLLKNIMNNNVMTDAIVCYYINLESETTKKQHIEQELDIFNNVTRINAFKHDNGAYGLAISDLITLDLAEKQDNGVVCIFEDDFQWEVSKADARAQINDILTRDFDLVLLSYHIPVVKLHDFNPPLSRVTNGQTTCGFMFKKSYIPELRRCWEKSRDNLLSGNSDLYAVDQTWKELQSNPLTYAAIPRMGRQLDGISSIERRFVSYGGGCFMIVLSCIKYGTRKARQDLSKCPFPYRYFIGIDSLSVVEHGDTVYLPCGDNYEDLPMKTYHALCWVREHYPHLDYVFKTDDDIVIDFEKLHSLYTTLDRTHVDYSGRTIKCNDHVSHYHYGKCNDKTKHVPTEVRRAIYCSGGGYFLSRKSVDLCLSGKTKYQSMLFEDHATGVILNDAGIMPRHIDIHNTICKW